MKCIKCEPIKILMIDFSLLNGDRIPFVNTRLRLATCLLYFHQHVISLHNVAFKSDSYIQTLQKFPFATDLFNRYIYFMVPLEFFFLNVLPIWQTFVYDG